MSTLAERGGYDEAGPATERCPAGRWPGGAGPIRRRPTGHPRRLPAMRQALANGPSVDVPARGTDLPLLDARLRPPSLGFAPLQRGRLLDALSRGVVSTPVTLLSGPPGSGKTVLAGSWLRAQGNGPGVAWLTLDEADDEPAAFWAYVAAALSRAGAEVPTPNRPMARAAAGAYAVRLAAALASREKPVVLVLDQADGLAGRSVLDGLDLLVRHASSRLRLVLCARAEPSLPLHRYRAAGLLTEIRGAQLACTATETDELLAAMDLRASADTVAALHAVTEGWVAAPRLAAAALHEPGASAAVVAGLTAEHGEVARYVSAEVLERQPAHHRAFLLGISVTDQLWPDLVDRLTGRPGGRHLLASLAAGNTFVERDGAAPGGYRLHPLLRQVLAAQLAAQAPGEFRAAHRTCAAWYAESGDPHRAAEHAIAAGDWHLAAGLLVDEGAVAQLLATGGYPGSWSGSAVPADAVGADAAVLRAAAALAGETDAEPADLLAAASAAEEPDARPALRAAAAAVCVAGAARSSPARVPDPVLVAADAAEARVAALPEGSAVRRTLTAVLSTARAAALLRSDAADDTCRDGLRAAMTAAAAAQAPRLCASTLAALALLEARDGRLRQAATLTGRYRTLCAEHRLPPGDHAAMASTAAAWIGVDRHKLVDARRWLANAWAAGADPAVTGPLLAVLQSRLRRVNRETASADEALRTVVGVPVLPRWVREEVVGEAVRVSLARDDTEAALRMLDGVSGASPRITLLRAAAGAPGRPGDTAPVPAVAHAPGLAVEGALLEVRRHLGAGDTVAAGVTLEEALRLAGPEELRRPFLDGPVQVFRLLRTNARAASCAGWLNPTAPAALSPQQPPDLPGTAADGTGPPTVIGTLSERELEVLRHLAEMLSTAEIAAAMFISVNTVRAHVRAVLRKLGAARRSDAVRRARDLRLI